MRVLYIGWPGYGDSIPARTEDVVGQRDEKFLDALIRTFGPPPPFHHFEPTTGTGEQDAGTWLGRIDDHVTVGDVERFLDGAVFRIDVLGRGGGGLPLLWDAIGTLSTLAWVAGVGAGANATIRAARYLNQRTAAKEWLDAGTDSEPSMALRIYASEERDWNRSEFDRRFQLGPEAGPKLLRELGYRKVASRIETWSDTRE